MIAYKKLLHDIKLIGQNIKQFAGKCPDIGIAKPRLTEHDISTERKLCSTIVKLDPQATFFAEEEHDTKSIIQKSLRVIDPISNTFNFIHGLPHYSICVSHIVDGITQFAAVYDPSMDEMFHAIKGKGGFLNSEKITVSNNKSDLSILVGPNLVPNNLSRNQKVIDLINKIQSIGTIRIIGSMGVQYAYVACGRADCMVGFPKDIFPEMAGKLLIEEAGGVFSTHAGEEINFETRDIIACNQSAYQILLEAIQ